ncbi:tetratricopeptide repeat-containing sulfotransferase family protein [Sphingomonas sp. Mn802worker]|uniref:tetratricopeptide repeat-containing sulfotransferase family protein n=1 Tax=Sphingomonas sp. Mn802worker TaxID=629773 RepID=UPI000362E8FA|nr:tetratricopeptide repeat-containing sulfotransferase family protein [Sphingomonas sp. Mn802worker]
MTSIREQVLGAAGADWRTGKRTRARDRLRDAIDQLPDDPVLPAMAGLLACQDGDPAAGAILLRRALTLDPAEQATRFNLVAALIDVCAFVEADEVAASLDEANSRAMRMRAFLSAECGRHDEAVTRYAAWLRLQPGDAQGWNNIGNSYTALGRHDDAIQAFERAVQIAPNEAAPHVNGAKALTDAGRDEYRLSWTRRAAGLLPDDYDIVFQHGLAEANSRDFDRAVEVFASAVARAPQRSDAYVELGLLYENLNRIDELEQLVATARASGVADRHVALIAAWLHRRRDRLNDAAREAELIGTDVAPVRRHHIRADIAERRGKAGEAFAEFTLMNQAALAGAGAGEEPDYLARVRQEGDGRLAATVRDAATSTTRTPASPVFIMGFPRSGTTLLDTLLMNDPRFHVLEELPIVGTIEAEARAGGGIDQADPDELRRRYFALLERVAPNQRGATVVDKFPLHMARVPLLHRMFPDARMIFVERHPFDVVLSCFMANFQPNLAMRHLTSLGEAAALYDAAMTSFTNAESQLPLTVHRFRYERLVADPDAELRALMRFLDVSWNDDLLDNQASASRRGHIATASYSQVTEPIYTRAIDRWRRYERYFGDAAALLRPWCEKLGYEA